MNPTVSARLSAHRLIRPPATTARQLGSSPPARPPPAVRDGFLLSRTRVPILSWRFGDVQIEGSFIETTASDQRAERLALTPVCGTAARASSPDAGAWVRGQLASRRNNVYNSIDPSSNHSVKLDVVQRTRRMAASSDGGVRPSTLLYETCRISSNKQLDNLMEFILHCQSMNG